MVEVIALGRGDIEPQDGAPYVRVERRRTAGGISATVVDIAFAPPGGGHGKAVAHDVSLTHTPLAEAVEQAKRAAERRGIGRVYVCDSAAADSA